MNFKIEEKKRRDHIEKQMQQLQEIINPKPPKEERERRLNERIAAREKKVSGPSETK